MKKQITKFFTTLLVMLIVFSLFGAFLTPTTGQTTAAQNPTPTPATGSNTSPQNTDQTVAAQEKAMNIIKNVMSVDLTKYTIELKINAIMDESSVINDNRTIINLMYALTPKESNNEDDVIRVFFAVERDVVANFFISPRSAQVITTTQYGSQYDAVKGFLEKYETCTDIDSSNLLSMIYNVDLTKNATITKGDTRLTVLANSFFGVAHVNLRWAYIINDVTYTALELSVNPDGFVAGLWDTRLLYTIGDTSINISKEQAIDLALDNLKYYSYDMPDGSVVKDFKVSRENVTAKLATGPVDYELRPYWDIRMILDEIYPGNVHGITVYIWADTGEIIEYSNMAYGGIIDPDGTNPTDSTTAPPPNSNTLIMGVAIVAVIVVAAVTGILTAKKKRK